MASPESLEATNLVNEVPVEESSDSPVQHAISEPNEEEDVKVDLEAENDPEVVKGDVEEEEEKEEEEDEKTSSRKRKATDRTPLSSASSSKRARMSEQTEMEVEEGEEVEVENVAEGDGEAEVTEGDGEVEVAEEDVEAQEEDVEAEEEEEEEVERDEDESEAAEQDDEELPASVQQEEEEGDSTPTQTPASSKPKPGANNLPTPIIQRNAGAPPQTIEEHKARVLAAMRTAKRGGGISTATSGVVVSGSYKESIGARRTIERRIANEKLKADKVVLARGYGLTPDEKEELKIRCAEDAVTAEAEAGWRAEFKRQCEAEDAVRFGLTSNELNDTALTDEQIVTMMLRPVHGASSSKLALRARLRQWITHTSVGDSLSHVATVVERFFGGLNGMAALADRHIGLQTALESLETALRQKEMMAFNTPLGDRMIAQIEAVRCNLDNFYTAKLNYLDMRIGTKSHLHAKIASLTSLNASLAEESKKLEEARASYSTFCQLFDQMLDKAKEMGLVRIEGRLYEPILSPKGDHTRAYRLWRTEGEIVEFVHRIGGCQKTNPELFGLLYERGNTWRALAETLKYCQEPRMPEVKLSRDWHAFRNGLYNIDEDRWYESGSLAFRSIPTSVIACMYHDCEFANDAYEWYVHNSPNGWMDIPVPPMDLVCSTQGWSQSEKEWWYCAGGRMLYPANVKEQWAKCWCCLGVAGSGKSTSLRFWSAFVPPGKIGVINNRCERVFVLQSLERTWVWMGMDIKEDWSIDPTLWQTMVDGNLLSISRKGLEAKIMDFPQHGAIASNRIMNWQDVNGQIIRRLFVHMFKKVPASSDGEDLVKSLDRYKGAALKKMNLGYRAKCASHGPGQLKDWDLPSTVAAIHQEIRRELNPVFAFLEGDDVLLNPNYYLCASEFRKGFVYFCQKSGLTGSTKLPSPTDSVFADSLAAKGLRFTKDAGDLPIVAGGKPPDANNRNNKTWIIGMSMRNYESNQANYVKPISNQNGSMYGGNRGFGQQGKYPMMGNNLNAPGNNLNAPSNLNAIGNNLNAPSNNLNAMGNNLNAPSNLNAMGNNLNALSNNLNAPGNNANNNLNARFPPLQSSFAATLPSFAATLPSLSLPPHPSQAPSLIPVASLAQAQRPNTQQAPLVQVPPSEPSSIPSSQAQAQSDSDLDRELATVIIPGF